MKILLVASSLSSLAGGTTASIYNFASALAGHCEKVSLICLDVEDSFEKAAQLKEKNVDVVLIKVKSKPCRSFFHLMSYFKKNLKDFDICYIHGLWRPPQLVAAYYARKLRIPYIVAVHGMLAPWAINNKKIRKFFYWSLFEKQNLLGAAAIQALTEAEKKHISEVVGPTKDIAVIPNGIWLDSTDDFKRRENKERHSVLFLGRIYKVKGLDMLIPAFANLIPKYPAWKLIIAGPDEGGYKRTLIEMTKKHNIEDNIQFAGQVHGERKEKLFITCDLLVLPSYTEGFSMVALEALKYSLPLLLTVTCNFPEAAKAGAAIEVPPSQEAIQRGLEQFMRLSTGQRKDMGKRGFQLIKEKYSVDNIAKQLIKKFENILRG